MKTNLSLIVIILLCLMTLGSNAQQHFINGIVTTFDSIAVIGADVKVKSSKQIVQTDTLGRFAIAVGASDKLKISAKGFNSQNVTINEKTKLVAVNLKLKSGPKAREYAIGYGYVKDVDRLNAIAQITNDDINFSNYSNMYELIRGRFAGVQVQNNGEIIIRGQNSLMYSSSALIIVDGMQVDNSILSTLVPAHIKSVNIIKDAGAAIYGARGANGVVIIETKRGNE